MDKERPLKPLLPIPKVIAHRGASAYAPENTMTAFQKACALGCQYIECDVMLSQDGEAFVIHDESLKRTTNGKGEVGLVTAEYLDSLDAGAWFKRRFRGEKIPRFQELLKWLNFSHMGANIEIKPFPGTTEATVLAVLRDLNRCGSKQGFLISSFDWPALYLCRELAPELPLGLLMDIWDKDWLAHAQALQCYSIHISKNCAAQARITEMKQQGYQVFVYTVNRKGLAEKLFNMGVDAVFSDYPDLLL